MATSLIGGMLANGIAPENIIACDINQQQLDTLADQFGVNVSTDNFASASASDVIMLAVKPQVMKSVCQPLSDLDHSSPRLFVSIAAGVLAQSMDKWLGGERSIVRCMPNTPALLQLGATGLYANSAASSSQKQQAQSILEAVGITLWVEKESELDAVTAVSGSGPAYFFYFIECLQAAGEKLGLSAETAAQLARQTALGASHMALDSDVVNLRQNVTSKNGTTEQAILSFQRDNLQSVVESATLAAQQRSETLSRELDE